MMAEKSPAKVAQLDEANLTKLRALETELGVRVVAFEKQHPMADLSEEQLKRLQATEKELDVVLVAYT
jgi:hypothetical protein